MSAVHTTDENDWTVMFFLAGDNSLSPSLIPQLKALREAGSQRKTKVIVRFDPSERGVRTGVFEMNREQRRKRVTAIGDGRDSFVGNMLEDEVSLDELEKSKGKGAKGLAAEAKKPDTTRADKALGDFLDYCVSNHPAKHYLLFLVGHGMVVGNDAFLPDDHPPTGVTLCRLGQILRDFAQGARDSGGSFDLVALHSCSMSAVEVAYQLRGSAQYMMASEGISFVGSLPYRQLTKKLLNTAEGAGERAASPEEVRELLGKLYFHCLHNSADFTVAGFSADLAMCDLGDDAKFEGLTTALRRLTRALRKGLDDPRANDLILLAHLKAQSYWQESYTDLYDFCRCLERGCGGEEGLGELKQACLDVITELDLDRADPFKRFVVFSEYIGPTYQYSHGLSVYFPWSKPLPSGTEDILKTYDSYLFTQALKTKDGEDDSWLAFLNEYFTKTRRAPRRGDRDLAPPAPGEGVAEVEPAEPFLPAAIFVPAAVADTALDVPDGKPTPAMSKSSPADSGGGGCNCASIKNYPLELADTVSHEARKAFKNLAKEAKG
ncbi:MAG TPA: clostripain-related cysteine peptidase [Pyrinomonadaceae bacterium]